RRSRIMDVHLEVQITASGLRCQVPLNRSNPSLIQRFTMLDKALWQSIWVVRKVLWVRARGGQVQYRIRMRPAPNQRVQMIHSSPGQSRAVLLKFGIPDGLVEDMTVIHLDPKRLANFLLCHPIIAPWVAGIYQVLVAVTTRQEPEAAGQAGGRGNSRDES